MEHGSDHAEAPTATVTELAARIRFNVQGSSSPGAVSTAVRDAPRLLDIHVDQVPWVLVLVATWCGFANGQPSTLVQARQPGHQVPGQDLADCGTCQVQVGRDAVGTHRRLKRRATIRRSFRTEVRLGLRRGRADKSVIPASPQARYRSAHFFAVAGEH